MRSPRQLSAPLLAVLLAVCALGTWRRLLIVQDYRNFAGDGWQYYHLAQNLAGDGHRYALGPPPQPPSWTRLPGYPILIAAAGKGAPRFNESDVAIRVARSQAVLDGATAVAAFLLAAELGLGAAPWLAAVLCLASPLLALATTYILSETLAVFLTTVTLWLVLRGCRQRALPHLALAGAFAGAALLVRADSVTLLPLLLVPLARSTEPPAMRLRAVGLSLACALAVFAPWPVRNLLRFHDAHLLGSSWVTRGGDPLPTGVQRWLLTWAVEPRDAADVAWKMTRATPVHAGALPAAAADSPDERRRLAELFDAYDRAGRITAEVDDGFVHLARERRDRDPRRYYLRLPMQRAREMWWTAAPEWEMPASSPTLGLPDGRDRLEVLTHRSLLVALVGLAVLLLWPGPARSLALLALLGALCRTIAVVFVVPGGTQRYLFELLPLLLVVASVGLLGPIELLTRRWLVPALASRR